MIPQKYYSDDDRELISKWLKKLGFGHCQMSDWSFTAYNMKKGLRIQIYFQTSVANSWQPRPRRPHSGGPDCYCLRAVEVFIRKAHKRYNGMVTTDYMRDKEWSPKKGEAAFCELDQNEFNRIILEIDAYLSSAEGDAVVKDTSGDILQNLVLEDLKTKLKCGGYTSVRFVQKAKTDDKRSCLSLSAPDCFRIIVLGLKSGELVISFGQSDGSSSVTIPVPTFEDPLFNPDLLYDAAVRAIKSMQSLEIDYKAFDTHRREIYSDVTKDFKDLWIKPGVQNE